MYPTVNGPRALRGLLAIACLAAAAWTAGPLAGWAQQAEEPELAPPPPGTWHAVANGDRVRDLARDGDIVWSATEGGGVVRWDLATGTHRQYLAPQDGLPSSDVRALLKDPRGRIWAATAEGLAWLDAVGDRWIPIAARHPDLMSDAATALAVGPGGGLWVGFEQRWDPEAVDPARDDAGAFVGGGLARYDTISGQWGPVFRALPIDGSPGLFEPLPSANVSALQFDGLGRLWVGTRPFYAWGTSDDDPTGDGSGGWRAVGGGLAIAVEPLASDGNWAQWRPETDACIPATIHALAADAAGTVWAGTAGRGLQAFSRGPATRACEPDGGHAAYRRARPPQLGLPGNTVLAVEIGADGRVWTGVADGTSGGRGVAVFEHGGTIGDGADQTADDRWTLIEPEGVGDPEAVLPMALSLSPAAAGSGPSEREELVVGAVGERSGEGWGLLRRTAADAWTVHATAAEGLPSNRISATAVHPITGDVWFGTEGRGVARWDGRRWQVWRWTAGQPGAGPTGDTVTALAIGPDGRVWVGSRPAVWDRAGGAWADGGLAVFDGQTWTPLQPGSSPLPSRSVQALAFDPGGRLWVGTENRGAAVYDAAGDTWTLFDQALAGEGFGGNNVTGIATDPATGDVWLAHGMALVCDPTKPPDPCEAIHQGGGVSRWDGRRWERWSKSGGAGIDAYGKDGEMTALAFDPAGGRLWAGAWAPAIETFHWIDGTGIDASLSGCPRNCRDDAWTATRFGDAGAVRALSMDTGGRLWVGLSRGGNGKVPARSGVRLLGAGDRWSAWTAAHSPLPGDEVTALGAAGEGGMWVGTLDRGAALWRPFEVRDRVFLPVMESN